MEKTHIMSFFCSHISPTSNFQIFGMQHNYFQRNDCPYLCSLFDDFLKDFRFNSTNFDIL